MCGWRINVIMEKYVKMKMVDYNVSVMVVIVVMNIEKVQKTK
jgi:hypothetical protein